MANGELAERIQAILDETGKTQAELARLCRVTRASVHKWLNGGGMTPEMVFSLSDLTGYQPRWIATGEGPKKAPGAALTPLEEQAASALRSAIQSADPARRDKIIALLGFDQLSQSPQSQSGANPVTSIRGEQKQPEKKDGDGGAKNHPPARKGRR